MNKIDIIKILKNINIPTDKYIVTMGAVLSVNGVRLAGDIDIIFDPSIKDELKEKGFIFSPKSKDAQFRNRYVSGSVEAFDNFFNIGTYKECLQKYSCEIIDGIPFMSLGDTLQVKSLFRRQKDIVDMAM